SHRCTARTEDGVYLCGAQSGHAARWIYKTQLSLPHARKRHHSHHALFRRVPAAFITVEEESSILNYGSAHGAPKRIANQFRSGVSLIADVVDSENDVR